jgi:transcriptional regulator with XRE-family HTH domain
MADTAPNYIAMIESQKRFPTDTMLERIAAALQREPLELFSMTPIQKQRQSALLV